MDVEFTLHLKDTEGPAFNLVQCRPLATIGETGPAQLPDNLADDRCLFRTRGHFMGGNINLAIERVIRVDAAIYSELTISQRYEVARLVGETVRASDQPTLLIGPGRWGTSSPELGVPVRFADIAGVAALAEVSEKAGQMVPDLSYGSHFFQDLVEGGVAYVALFPEDRHCDYFPDHLPAARAGSRHPDKSVEQAVRVCDLSGQPLQLSGDVVRQQLACYYPD